MQDSLRKDLVRFGFTRAPSIDTRRHKIVIYLLETLGIFEHEAGYRPDCIDFNDALRDIYLGDT